MLILSWIDYFIIFVYFVLMFVIGFVVKKGIKNVADYFVAGRRLTLPLFVATLVSTWYGGLFGVGELSYNYGIVNWLTQGFFWYLSYLFFALFLAKKINQSRLYTVPDQLERFYDKKSRVLGAIFNFIMVTPAPYVLSLGIVFTLLFGWPSWIGVIAGTGVVLFYTVRGGFVADVYTDAVQFVLMMIGVILVIPFAIAKYGGLSFLRANLPATHLTLTGTWTTQMILVWGFIAFWTLVDPGFYQRCYAAKDSNLPKKGILISIIFWAIIDICTTTTGLYARAAMPNIVPTFSYAIFSNAVLPVVLRGLFFAGVFATIMSTVDSFTFLGGMNISNDIYKRVLRPKATDKQVMRVTRIGIYLTAGIACLIAIFFHSLVGMWYTIGTVGISALLVPMMFGFFYKGRKSGNAAFYSMIIGSVVSSIWLVNGYLHMVEGYPSYIWGIEPMYSGLVFSLVSYIAITFIDNRIKKFNSQKEAALA